MVAEVRNFMQRCEQCQYTLWSPLPIIEVPFERVKMDLVGPLPKSTQGHEYVMVLVDYATRYLRALPL